MFGNFFGRSQEFCLDLYEVFAPDSLHVPRDFPYYKSMFCAGKLYVCFKSTENAELSLCCLLKMPRGKKSPGSSRIDIQVLVVVSIYFFYVHSISPVCRCMFANLVIFFTTSRVETTTEQRI